MIERQLARPKAMLASANLAERTNLRTKGGHSKWGADETTVEKWGSRESLSKRKALGIHALLRTRTPDKIKSRD